MEADGETDYTWETKPMYRDGTNVLVATIFHFDDDEPLDFYYDAAGEMDRMVIIEFDDGFVKVNMDHPVVKAFADDENGRLSKAAAVTPKATDREIRGIHMMLHPEMVEE